MKCIIYVKLYVFILKCIYKPQHHSVVQELVAHTVAVKRTVTYNEQLLNVILVKHWLVTFSVTPVIYSFHFTESNSIEGRMGHEI